MRNGLKQNYIYEEPLVLDDFSDVSGWNLNITGGLTVERNDNTAYIKNGSHSLKLTVPAGGSGSVQKAINIPFKSLNNTEYWVYVEDFQAISSVGLTFTNLDVGQNNWAINACYGGNRSNDNWSPKWNKMKSGISERYPLIQDVYGTSPFYSMGSINPSYTAKQMKLSVAMKAGKTTNVYISPICYNEKSKGKVILTFDEVIKNSTAYINTVLPKLDSYGWKGTFGSVLDSVISTDSVDFLKQLKADGHAVIGSTTTEVGEGGTFSSLDASKVPGYILPWMAKYKEWGLDYEHMYLKGNFGTGENAPYNPNTVEAVRACGIKTARTIIGVPDTNPPSDLLWLKCFFLSAYSDLTWFKSSIKQAILSDKLVILGWHSDLSHFTALADFIKTYVDLGYCDVVTQVDYYLDLIGSRRIEQDRTAVDRTAVDRTTV